MVKCTSNKRVYLTNDVAEDALIEAHIRFEYTNGRGPIAVYKCDDCGYYHLTSQGQMSERLAQNLKNGKIMRQKEANQWEHRWKNK